MRSRVGSKNSGLATIREIDPLLSQPIGGKRVGCLTNFVTNGYITREGLDLMGPFLDSFRMDLKSFKWEEEPTGQIKGEDS